MSPVPYHSITVNSDFGLVMLSCLESHPVDTKPSSPNLLLNLGRLQ